MLFGGSDVGFTPELLLPAPLAQQTVQPFHFA
jgi:hypothetical protein